VHSGSNASWVSHSGTDDDSLCVRRREESDWLMVIAVSEMRGAYVFRLKHSKESLLELSDPEGGGMAHQQNIRNYSQVDTILHYPRLATHHLLAF